MCFNHAELRMWWYLVRLFEFDTCICCSHCLWLHLIPLVIDCLKRLKSRVCVSATLSRLVCDVWSNSTKETIPKITCKHVHVYWVHHQEGISGIWNSSSSNVFNHLFPCPWLHWFMCFPKTIAITHRSLFISRYTCTWQAWKLWLPFQLPFVPDLIQLRGMLQIRPTPQGLIALLCLLVS